MPAPKQGESFVMKHRLAGAAVLIGFAVIVLPMLLGGPKEDDSDTDNTAASSESDTKVFRSNITPISGATPSAAAPDREALERTVDELLNPDAPPPGDGAAAEETGAATAGDGDGEQATGSAPTGEIESDGSRIASRDEEGGEPEPAESEEDAAPAEVERGWIVQVGTFTKSGNADKLVADLEERGFTPSTTDVDTSSGPATRVWVGPFETRWRRRGSSPG